MYGQNSNFTAALAPDTLLLRLFRLNDPYRLGLVLLIMLGLRLPFWLTDVPGTWHEQHWLLLGERLGNGAAMYSDMWDTTGPLPVLIYSVLHSLFGKSALAHQIVALLLVFIQATLFNTTLLARKAYNENTYIPGLIYGLLASWYFDFYTLSPLLIGLTFAWLAFHQLFRHLQSRVKADEAILLMGMMLGLAVLCYQPFVLLLIPMFLALGFFSNTVGRRYMLIIYGLMLPFMLSGVYYFTVGSFNDFVRFYLIKPFTLGQHAYVAWDLVGSLTALPILMLMLAIFRVVSYPRFVNYQNRLQQIMLVWLLVSVIMFLQSHHRSAFHLLVFVPPMAFFFSHYVLLFRKRRWGEVTFWVIFLPILVVNLNVIRQWFSFLPGPESVQVSAAPMPDHLKNRSMWVVGEYPEYYQHARSLGTAFYNWHLAADLVLQQNTYAEILELQAMVEHPLPEVVVDPEKHFAKLLQHYPEWKAVYSRVPNTDFWEYRP